MHRSMFCPVILYLAMAPLDFDGLSTESFTKEFLIDMMFVFWADINAFLARMLLTPKEPGL